MVLIVFSVGQLIEPESNVYGPPGLGACWPFWPAQESLPSSFQSVARPFWPRAVRAFGIPECSPSRFTAFALGIGPARLARFCPLGIEVEKQGFGTPCLITGQKFQGVGLKLTVFILTFRDPFSRLCQKSMRVAV